MRKENLEKIAEMSPRDLGEMANFVLGISYNYYIPIHEPFENDSVRSVNFHLLCELNDSNLVEMVHYANSLAKLDGFGESYINLHNY